MSNQFAGWRTNSASVKTTKNNPVAASASTRRGDREHEEQRRLFLFFDDVLAVANPELTDELQDIFAVPNGGHRSRRTAGRLRAEGVRRGVPDVQGLIPRGIHHGIVVEMKADANGRPSPEQRDRLQRLRRRGYCAECCGGWIAAAQVFCRYLDAPWQPGWVERVEWLATRRKRRRDTLSKRARK